jgi:Fur family ferric uptake transcriptional regulator
MIDDSGMKTNTEHCDALETLEKTSLYKTPQRIAVLDTLISSSVPLSVNDILKKICTQQKINKVTVYRILTSFKGKGIVREIETARGISYYEISCHHNPVHAHFSCRHCGMLVCLDPLTLSQTWDWFTKPRNFAIDHITINMTGTCHRCER